MGVLSQAVLHHFTHFNEAEVGDATHGTADHVDLTQDAGLTEEEAPVDIGGEQDVSDAAQAFAAIKPGKEVSVDFSKPDLNTAQKMEAVFGKEPEVDKSKLDMESMAKLRVAAFEAEDADAARTWAANLADLKKQCFADNTVKPCQVLATESMYMAAKYYQMWDESMSMWDQSNGADFQDAGGVGSMDHTAGAEDGSQLAATAADASADAATEATGATTDAAAEDATASAASDVNTEALTVAEAGMGFGGIWAAIVGAFLPRKTAPAAAGQRKPANSFL
ncbi:unnamed protein product [Amoebophrya sp. A25]|nr:unnamed protein product [Amoebophrya sp. A25]|eukprot:GSA25T00009794001.1